MKQGLGLISTRSVRRRRAQCVTAAIATGLAVGVLASSSATAADYAGPICTTGSADRCFYNYSWTAGISFSAMSVEYQRDQLCAKARDGHINGPVSGGSSCNYGGYWWGSNYTSPSTPKKAYGYWAGNGGAILIQTGVLY